MGISDFDSAFANNCTQAALLWQENIILETQNTPPKTRTYLEAAKRSSSILAARTPF